MAKVDAMDGESASFPAPLNQGPVEARSLSSITSIASNPPNYPRNPAQKKLDPLVLYIVRVPGSRDVFLSPLKPPTKSSVSAEAINSSLYYLHVASPDDDILLEEYEQECEERARLRKEGLLDDDHDLPLPGRGIARLNNVRRKPVKPVDKVEDSAGPDAVPDAVPPPLRRRPLPSQPSDQPSENRPPSLVADQVSSPVLPPRPTFSNTSNTAEAMARLTGVGEDRPPMPPRPLPSVPPHELPFDSPAPPRNNRWSALPGYISNNTQHDRGKYEAASPIRHSLDVPRPQMRPSSSHELPPPYPPTGYPTRSPGQSPTRRSRDTPRSPSRQPGFHITLIRRDPTHGIQWNAATMSTPQLDGSGIDIDVSTPGYSRFAGKNEPLSLDALGLNLPAEARNMLSRHPNIASLTESSAGPQDSVSRDQPRSRHFHRKLVVSRPNPEEPRGSSDLSMGRPSMDSVSSNSNITPSKLKSGYYTFTSPWNGTCTFSTSINGRSLKCKHMIPSPGFSNPNQENPAVTVAEIRFNTPFQSGHLHNHQTSSYASPFALSQTTMLRDPSTNPDPSAPYYYDPSTLPSKRAALVNLINQKLNRRSSNSSSSDGGNDPPPPLPVRHPPSQERIDLSLAREKAGGGMRGNSAKLGKLVIEDEGIKMLDLVVAACMAVWWRGYYY
ncbi:hypothetical protein BDW62DRAFT_114482 [Aspergillus aurantiobrunneus]